jgi:hypothetical protein
MTTMKNRERMRGYQAHADMLKQAADSTAERDEVRRILGEAQAAYKRQPWPYAPSNHAHRYSTCKDGPCQQGRKPCPTPDACQMPERPSPRSGDLWLVTALILAGWAAVVLTLVAVGMMP